MREKTNGTVLIVFIFLNIVIANNIKKDELIKNILNNLHYKKVEHNEKTSNTERIEENHKQVHNGDIELLNVVIKDNHLKELNLVLKPGKEEEETAKNSNKYASNTKNINSSGKEFVAYSTDSNSDLETGNEITNEIDKLVELFKKVLIPNVSHHKLRCEGKDCALGKEKDDKNDTNSESKNNDTAITEEEDREDFSQEAIKDWENFIKNKNSCTDTKCKSLDYSNNQSSDNHIDILRKRKKIAQSDSDDNDVYYYNYEAESLGETDKPPTQKTKSKKTKKSKKKEKKPTPEEVEINEIELEVPEINLQEQEPQTDEEETQESEVIQEKEIVTESPAVNDVSEEEDTYVTVEAYDLLDMFKRIRQMYADKLFWYITDPDINSIGHLKLSKGVDKKFQKLKLIYQKSNITEEKLLDIIEHALKIFVKNIVLPHDYNNNAIYVSADLYDKVRKRKLEPFSLRDDSKKKRSYARERSMLRNSFFPWTKKQRQRLLLNKSSDKDTKSFTRPLELEMRVLDQPK